jgi:hypothetical protein
MTIVENTEESHSPLGIEEGSFSAVRDSDVFLIERWSCIWKQSDPALLQSQSSGSQQHTTNAKRIAQEMWWFLMIISAKQAFENNDSTP